MIEEVTSVTSSKNQSVAYVLDIVTFDCCHKWSKEHKQMKKELEEESDSEIIENVKKEKRSSFKCRCN